MKKVERYIYIIVIVVLLGVMVGGSIYSLSKDKDNKNPEAETKKDKEKISLSDSELEEYLSYVPFLDATLPFDGESSFEYQQYADAYDGRKNTIESINNEILLYKAYFKAYLKSEYESYDDESLPEFNNLEICNFKPCKLLEYYKETKINKNLLNMYNKKSLDIKEAPIPGGALYYQSPYYAVHYGAGSDKYFKINKIIKSEKTSDYIIIEEEALFLRNAYYDDDTENVENKVALKVYKNTYDMKNNNSINKEIIYIDESNLTDDSIKKDSIDLSSYEFTKYKHTFKKNSTGYYWYQTEVI